MSDALNIISAKDVCDRIGRGVIAEAVGVGLTSVSAACVCGRFPASWFIVIRKLCVDRGFACPVDLFKFKDFGGQLSALPEGGDGEDLREGGAVVSVGVSVGAGHPGPLAVGAVEDAGGGRLGQGITVSDMCKEGAGHV